MSIKDYTTLRKHGSRLSRADLSEKVIAAVREFNAGASYKNAMILAGRLKAIAAMTPTQDYWGEQVDKGFHRELNAARNSQ